MVGSVACLLMSTASMVGALILPLAENREAIAFNCCLVEDGRLECCREEPPSELCRDSAGTLAFGGAGAFGVGMNAFATRSNSAAQGASVLWSI